MNNRTIKNLVNDKNSKVYVYLANSEIGNKFLQQAESEGFVFGDNTKPTSRCYAEVMAVNDNLTINFVGANGMIAFGSGTKTITGKNFVRVDFEKYINGAEDYSFNGKH